MGEAMGSGALWTLVLVTSVALELFALVFLAVKWHHNIPLGLL